MMQAYRTENSYRSAARLSPAELRAAMASGEILQATALAFDTRRQLRFELGGVKAVMPFAQCADGAETGTVRDIAVLTRVGRPTCFVIEGLDTDEDGAPCYRLSRAEAQRLCKAEYLDTLSPGDILPCTVTHIEPFGAFCDVGCGISALLPIDCMSVSRISSPADRVSVGQQILCAIKNRDAQGRFVLTIRELLGTWAENAARFTVGETVVGIVRSVEEYGTFVEIAPNLAGLAESCSGLAPGQAVSVYIKNILPEKMKIKLVGTSSPRDIWTGGCTPHRNAPSALRQILPLRLAIRAESLYTNRKSFCLPAARPFGSGADL